ncbi:unnamed protein product [Leuciscus chuanchicus]
MLVKDLYVVLLARGDRKSHSYLTHDSYRPLTATGSMFTSLTDMTTGAFSRFFSFSLSPHASCDSILGVYVLPLLKRAPPPPLLHSSTSPPLHVWRRCLWNQAHMGEVSRSFTKEELLSVPGNNVIAHLTARGAEQLSSNQRPRHALETRSIKSS